jgi:hypothetical protein
MTPLDKTLKRALKIKDDDYVITLTPDALKITQKGRRIGLDLTWADLVSGQSALAVALQASLGKFEARGSRGRKTKTAPERQPKSTAAAERTRLAAKHPTRKRRSR